MLAVEHTYFFQQRIGLVKTETSEKSSNNNNSSSNNNNNNNNNKNINIKNGIAVPDFWSWFQPLSRNSQVFLFVLPLSMVGNVDVHDLFDSAGNHHRIFQVMASFGRFGSKVRPLDIPMISDSCYVPLEKKP